MEDSIYKKETKYNNGTARNEFFEKLNNSEADIEKQIISIKEMVNSLCNISGENKKEFKNILSALNRNINRKNIIRLSTFILELSAKVEDPELKSQLESEAENTLGLIQKYNIPTIPRQKRPPKSKKKSN